MKNWIVAALALLAALFVGVPAQAADWKKAETRHFVIYSDGSTGQLESFAEDLERFDALLRWAFQVPEPGRPVKLTIYLLGDSGDVARLYGRPGSGVAGFYSPRLEGSIAISHRAYSSGGFDGQTVLFHEYAHHFMLNNYPVAIPSWLVEGFAEFVSTAEFKRDGNWAFGKVPQDRQYELFNLPKIPIERLLTERMTRENEDQLRAFYGWSWALTHMLFLGGENDQHVLQYLRLLNSGTPSLEAAKQAFGDLDQLERDLWRYVRGGVIGRRSDRPLPFDEGVEITQLSDTEGELRELILLRRVGTGQQPLDKTRDALARLAPTAGTADAWYQLAHAEFSLAEDQDEPDWSAAQAAVERALAVDAAHVRANVLMGRILAERAAAGTSDDPDIWNRALAFIARANQADPHDPVPLFYFAQTELREGVPSEGTNGALARAFSLVRESPEARTAYAFDLARVRKYDEAIALLQVLANDPHGGERGREAIEAIEKLRDSGGTATIRMVPLDDEGDDSDGDDGEGSDGDEGTSPAA